jgi:hypothetical protein
MEPPRLRSRCGTGRVELQVPEPVTGEPWEPVDAGSAVRRPKTSSAFCVPEVRQAGYAASGETSTSTWRSSSS